MGVEASVVVEFGDETVSGNVSVEIDEQHPNNLDSDGNVKSSFLPTDRPVFLIHHDNTVRVTSVGCTNGSVSRIGTNISRVKRSEGVIFSSVESEESIDYFRVNTVTPTWYGHTANLQVENSVVTPTTGTFPALCDLSYVVRYNEQWMLRPPALNLTGDQTYKIAVVVYMENIV